MKKLSYLLAFVFAIVFIQSCQKEDINGGTTDAAPPLPPLESLVMPFDGFKDADTTIFAAHNGGIEPRTPYTFGNWFYAASNVVVWNILIGAATVVPVAAFAESFNHEPVILDVDTYLWSYSFFASGSAYTAKLTGTLLGDGNVEWAMNISQIGGFTDVTWFKGVVSRDNKEGSWTLNYQPENPQPFIKIDYEKGGDEAYMIRYTNIIPNHPENGQYIEYRAQPNEDFNRAYDVFRGNQNFLQIEWDIPSTAGRVKHQPNFGDNDWHCWNERKRDSDC